MTFIVPASGAGVRISGSRFGGQITPSVRASLSLGVSSLSLGASALPVVPGGCLPSGLGSSRSPGAQAFGSGCTLVGGGDCADAAITPHTKHKKAAN